MDWDFLAPVTQSGLHLGGHLFGKTPHEYTPVKSIERNKMSDYIIEFFSY